MKNGTLMTLITSAGSLLVTVAFLVLIKTKGHKMSLYSIGGLSIFFFVLSIGSFIVPGAVATKEWQEREVSW